MVEKTRRIPAQGRSQATVEAILEATFQLLEAGGLDALTTDRIARRAGVSIGTLYQYFGGKHEILEAIAERRATATRERIAGIVVGAPKPDSIRAIVRSLRATFDGSPETRRTLSGALFGTRGEKVLMRHHEAFLSTIEGAEIGLPLTREQAFVLTHAATGLLRAASDEPELGLDADALDDELVRLMESFIAAVAAARAGSAGADR